MPPERPAAHGEADTAADHHLAEHVAAIGVGAEKKGAGFDLLDLRERIAMLLAVVGDGACEGLQTQRVAFGAVAVYRNGCSIERASVEHGAER